MSLVSTITKMSADDKPKNEITPRNGSHPVEDRVTMTKGALCAVDDVTDEIVSGLRSRAQGHDEQSIIHRMRGQTEAADVRADIARCLRVAAVDIEGTPKPAKP